MSSLRNFRVPRMLDWLIYAAVLMLAVWLLAPQQLPVSLYKLSLISLAAVAGYWIDRSLFPYARPDVFLSFEADHPLLRLMGMAMLRRAIIVAAAMIAVGLGA